MKDAKLGDFCCFLPMRTVELLYLKYKHDVFIFYFFTVQLSVPLAAAMLMELGGKIKLKKEVL